MIIWYVLFIFRPSIGLNINYGMKFIIFFSTIHDSWLMIRDFNDIFYTSKKLGDPYVYFNDNNWLINFMYSSGVIDLGIIDSQYT